MIFNLFHTIRSSWSPSLSSTWLHVAHTSPHSSFSRRSLTQIIWSVSSNVFSCECWPLLFQLELNIKPNHAAVDMQLLCPSQREPQNFYIIFGVWKHRIPILLSITKHLHGSYKSTRNSSYFNLGLIPTSAEPWRNDPSVPQRTTLLRLDLSLKDIWLVCRFTPTCRGWKTQ